MIVETASPHVTREHATALFQNVYHRVLFAEPAGGCPDTKSRRPALTSSGARGRRAAGGGRRPPSRIP
ncbi:hypothetical protein EVAR_34014_1 [Eumeta japonica]|uniref:Uncharacterized protein n=1 Tax=Eumeta variegata TaxID=151549 RepID=A0A4C1VSC7_EUMVA|nr:hypothetical protein EVAR_34014_1 [Eumeta japonica]